MSENKMLIFVGIVGALALVLGAVGVSYAYAHEPEPPVDERPFYGGGRFPGGGMFGRAAMRGGYSLVEATAEVTRLSREEVIAALEDGETFAQIAEGQDVDPQDIVDAAVVEHQARLQETVEAERLTNEQMEEMLADIEEHVTEQLDETHEPRLFGGDRFAGGHFGGDLVRGGFFGRFGGGSWTTMFDAVADALGLDPTALFERLHSGESVAEIAEEADVDLGAVQDAADAGRIEERKQAIEEAVEGGRLSEEQGEWMLEGLEKGYGPGGRGCVPGEDYGPGRGFAPRGGGRGRGMGW